MSKRLINLEDILCYPKTFEDHVEVVRKVLQALQCQGIKFRPEKCEMFKGEVHYVGASCVLRVFESILESLMVY